MMPRSYGTSKGTDVKGKVGPFDLWVLAFVNMQERTPILFCGFKHGSSEPKVFMCTNPTKYGEQTALPVICEYVMDLLNQSSCNFVWTS
jgi:hypothetical protein